MSEGRLAIEPAVAAAVYAGTGPKEPASARSRRDEQGQRVLQRAQAAEHVLCLGLAPNGTLYAGTDKSGLIYRIDKQGKGFVVYSASQSEVRNLQVTADGTVYAGTSSPTKRHGVTTSASSGSRDSSVAAIPTDKPVTVAAKKPVAESGESLAVEKIGSSSDTKEPSKSGANGAPAFVGADRRPGKLGLPHRLRWQCAKVFREGDDSESARSRQPSVHRHRHGRPAIRGGRKATRAQ